MTQFEVKAGGFILNTGTGSQTVTGVGFLPTGVIVWAHKVTSETAAVDYSLSYGMSDGTRTKVGGQSALDGATTPTDRVQDDSEIINLMDPSDGSVDVVCTMTSFNSDGFVINVGTNVSAEAILVKYLAFGGTVNLRVDQVLASASPVDTLSFQPNLLIAQNSGQLAGDLATQHAIASPFGVAERFSGSTRQWCLLDFKGEDDHTDAGGIMIDDRFTGQRFNTTDSWELSLTSFNTDGFTWTGSDGDVFWYMAMELPAGIEAFATTFQKLTGAGPITQAVPDATGFSELVQAYVLGTANHTDKTSFAARDSKMSFGAYSQRGTPSQFVCSGTLEEGAGTQVDQICNNDHVLHAVTVPVALDAIGEPVTITDTQPDINWSTNDSLATWIGYLAFEMDPLIEKNVPETVQRTESPLVHRGLVRTNISKKAVV